MKTNAVVFITMLVLVFSTVACKQSGEADKPVKKAAETSGETVESNTDKIVEKADEAVSSAVEEVSKKVDETVSNTVDEVNKKVDEAVGDPAEGVNKNIDNASKKIDGVLGINTEK
jgi:gas vesicle protein